MKCSCGEELKFEPAENYLGNDTDTRYRAYCGECKKLWDLVECTESYEEMIVNEVIEPEHGEYKDRTGEWFYADGKSMEV